MFRKFPSIGFPDKYGYAYDTQSYRTDNRGVASEFRMFETYGDGMTQHSGDWSVTTEYLADYLLSMAQFALTDDEFTNELYFTMHRFPPDRDIDFASTVIYKAPPEEKRYVAKRYFSLEERKISSSESKRHDKRYFEITDNFDGKPKSIVSVLLWEKRDWIGQWEAFQTVCAVYDWCQKNDVWMEIPGRYMKWFEGDPHNEGDKARLLRDGYEAMRMVTEAYQKRENVKRSLECYQRNLEWRAKRAAEKAAEQEAANQQAAS